MRTRQIASDDVKLHVVEMGDSNHPAILFLHGFPDCHQVWLAQMEALADDYHVISFDMRGVGRSTRSRRSDSYHMDRLVADVAAVITATRGHQAGVHLVGHDWGSVIGWHFVCHPRYRQQVLSWSSMSGPHLGLLWHWVQQKFASGEVAQVRKALNQLAHSWYIFMFQVPMLGKSLFATLGPRIWRQTLRAGGVPADDDYLNASPAEVRSITLEAIKIYQQNAMRRRAVPAQGSIDMPVQLIVARRDRFVRPEIFEDLELFVPRLQRSELDANHWAQRARPQEMTQLVRDFIESVEAGETTREQTA
jgi:pimeloyl-ACP methyl ester carboxylesterase